MAGSIDFKLGVADRGWALSAGYGAFGRFVQKACLGARGRTQTDVRRRAILANRWLRPKPKLRVTEHYPSSQLRQWRVALSAHVDCGGCTGRHRGRLASRRLRLGCRRLLWQLPIRLCAAAECCVCAPPARRDARSTEGKEGQNAEIGAWLGVDSFRLQENFTGFVQRSRLLESVSGLGDLIEQEDDSLSFGLNGRYRSPLYQHTDWFGARLELGASARFDDIKQSQNLIYAVRNETWDRRVDADVSASNLGVWGDVELRVAELVELRAGLRANLLHYVVDDRLGNFVPTIRDREDTIVGFRRSAVGTVWGPRASVVVKPAQGLTLLAAYGQGFRSPQARTLEDGERAPFTKVHSADLGARYQSEALTASLSGFLDRAFRRRRIRAAGRAP